MYVQLKRYLEIAKVEGVLPVAGTLLAQKARFGHICGGQSTPYRSSPVEKTQVDPPVSQTGL
jgi:hypothetical protein